MSTQRVAICICWNKIQIWLTANSSHWLKYSVPLELICPASFCSSLLILPPITSHSQMFLQYDEQHGALSTCKSRESWTRCRISWQHVETTNGKLYNLVKEYLVVYNMRGPGGHDTNWNKLGDKCGIQNVELRSRMQLGLPEAGSGLSWQSDRNNSRALLILTEEITHLKSSGGGWGTKLTEEVWVSKISMGWIVKPYPKEINKTYCTHNYHSS